MIDPYRMIVINIVASIILFAGIFIYRYVFPKKRVNLLVLLLLISLLPLISILRKGTYESGALSSHAKIAMPFYDTLIEGNIIPRWSSLLCATWGCPNYIFMYPLPYYVVSIFHIMSIPIINSIKLLIAISFVGSGVAMYLWAREELGKIPGFVSSIFYLYAPYRLVDMHFRVAIGELMSFMFMPLCLLFAKKSIETQKPKWVILGSFSIALLILSHQAISLSFFPFLILYGIFVWYFKKRRKIQTIFPFFSSICLGLLLSSFYFATILFESKYLQWTLNPSVSFAPLTELIYSTWRYGLLFQGPNGELSFVIGYIQLFLVLIAMFLFFKKKLKKRDKNLLLFSVISFFILFFMMQSISKPLWDYLPLIKNFQFSYRLLAITALFTSLIAGIVVKEINNRFFIAFICFIVIFTTILNWGNRRAIPDINDTFLRNQLLDANPCECPDLNSPKWVDFSYKWAVLKPKSPIEIIDGNADVVQISRTTTAHKYLIYAKTKVLVKENTFYFPGWELKINEKKQDINYQQKKYPGVITFELNPGLYNIELSFNDTKPRRVFDLISLTTFILIVLYSAIIVKRNRYFQRRR